MRKEEEILTKLKIELFDKMVSSWDNKNKRFDINVVRDSLTTYCNMEEMLKGETDE